MPKAQDHQPAVNISANTAAVSWRPFRQQDFIRRVNRAHRFTSVNALFSRNLIEGGQCAGLVKIWYRSLRQGNNLIDELANDSINPQLIQRILQTQTATQSMGFKRAVVSGEAKVESDTAASAKTADDDRRLGVYQSLGFSEENCRRNDCIGADALREHLMSLKGHGDQLGLHEIATGNIDAGRAHVFAFTYEEEGYLFFDPNEGEMLFDDYDKMVNYIMQIHIQNVFQFPTDQSFVVTDSYHEGATPTPPEVPPDEPPSVLPTQGSG